MPGRRGFAGIDYNFEGDSEKDGYVPDSARARILSNFARLVVEVRNRWAGLLTITPMRFEIATQVQYIKNSFGSADWMGCVSWIDAQFYYYADMIPKPQFNVASDYESVLSLIQVPPRMLAAGFPLSQIDRPFNQSELEYAKGAVRDIYSKHRDLAGFFIWRFRGAFLDAHVPPLNWGSEFYNILQNS